VVCDYDSIRFHEEINPAIKNCFVKSQNNTLCLKKHRFYTKLTNIVSKEVWFKNKISKG